jgi:predicted SprT family Zn-dependent metalloprotease
LALNPDNFVDRTDIEILSTLVHEQCHLYQIMVGSPPRKGYHDKEWGAIMKEIGLYPSSTGEPAGREVGQRMSHYIIQGGKFEITAGAFLLGGKKLLLESIPIPKVEREKKKTREKFLCPTCQQSAMAKKTARLMCADCKEMMVIEEE